jgi:hypothetical protein
MRGARIDHARRAIDKRLAPCYDGGAIGNGARREPPDAGEREMAKLEHDVPLPQRPEPKWPIAEMLVGDSFVGNHSALRAARRKHEARGWRFQRQKLGPDLWRIWRVL